MKRLLFAVLLLTATSAWADWVHIGDSSGDGGFDVYSDPATLSRSGDLAKMWGRINYKSPLQTAFGKRYSSLQRHSEYDCKASRSRILEFALFSGQMGGGDVVFSSTTPSRWEPILPGTIAEVEIRLACPKP